MQIARCDCKNGDPTHANRVRKMSLHGLLQKGCRNVQHLEGFCWNWNSPLRSRSFIYSLYFWEHQETVALFYNVNYSHWLTLLTEETVLPSGKTCIATLFSICLMCYGGSIHTRTFCIIRFGGGKHFCIVASAGELKRWISTIFYHFCFRCVSYVMNIRYFDWGASTFRVESIFVALFYITCNTWNL